ncbi:LuxR C-terminal-related transcriptional regulator [Pseudonocardia yunnanensis]|uniref:LuxR C-terminal-related transcriptional regulator n=1 Tax=Pseudonocardia yunnanensis TaxID=58107 RepID=A0ABW4EPT1_9PSEU
MIGHSPTDTTRRARGHAARIPGGKTTVPELPGEFVPRPALLDRLDAAGAAQVVVVSAPAGYGKTLLLADWVRSRALPDTAWVSVDADDDDPGRFWSAVLTALAGLPSMPADSAVRRAVRGSGPGHEIPDGDVLSWLAEALDVLDPPVRLVLDDLQELTAPRPLRELARLVARRPAGLRLVLSSRVDPPLALPRLRQEGRLHEIRAEQLRFDVTDTVTLLQSAGLDLDPVEVALLHARTDGWVAALRLAALALRRSEDPAAFLLQFSGDERSIADYLTGEILSGLADDAQDFLRAVSVCSVLPTALAIALSDRPDAGRLLDEMGRETALVERAGPGEHRIHALLRSYLRANLHRHRPGLHQRLQTVAACWWAERGEHVHALRHAERAGDEKQLAQLLRSAVPLLASADLTPLRRALTAVGPTARAADPWLALVSAIAHLEERAFAAAAVDLQHARLTWPATPDRELEVLRSTAELLAPPGIPTHDVATPPPVAGEGSPDVRPELTALLHLSRAAAELSPDGHGDLDVAVAELEECTTLATTHGLGRVEVQSSTLAAAVAALRRDHRGMVAAAGKAAAAALRHSLHPSRWSACATGMLAYADLLQGDPAGARARVETALTAPDPITPEAAFALRSVHGAALADDGERDRGAAEMRSARRELGGAPAPRVLCAALGVLEHRTTLLQGNTPVAAEIQRWLESRIGPTGEVLLLQAWTDVITGRHEVARAVVDPVRASAVPVLLPHTMLEIHLLDVEAALESGDDAEARGALDAAFAAAGTIGVVRPFALAGPRTRQLLADRRRPTGSPELEARLATLAVCAEPAAVLSERELVVLALLPSLRGAGEIASELTVSVNTVKSHIRSIYAKLGVSTRREAVQRASERGLLP